MAAYDLFTQARYVGAMRSLPVLLLVAFAASAHAEVVSGPAYAVDGDTLVLNDRQVRLAGIDAPELDQSCQRDGQAWACGEEAKRQLNGIIAGQTVYCQGEGVDQYGRLLGTCSANRMNLNATMVEYGWATAFRAYSDDYLVQEHRARSAKAGIWKAEFALPEQHRIATRRRAEDPPQSRPSGERRTTPRQHATSRGTAVGAVIGFITFPACSITSRQDRKKSSVLKQTQSLRDTGGRRFRTRAEALLLSAE